MLKHVLLTLIIQRLFPVSYSSCCYCIQRFAFLCIPFDSVPCIFMAAIWNRAGHYIFMLWFLLYIFLSFFLFLWPPYVIGQAIIFLPCGYFFYLSIFFFSSPNLSRQRLDVRAAITLGIGPHFQSVLFLLQPQHHGHHTLLCAMRLLQPKEEFHSEIQSLTSTHGRDINEVKKRLGLIEVSSNNDRITV